MDDKVSREAKLAATKELVSAYIKSAVKKDGDNQHLDLSVEEMCAMFKKVYGVIDETLPNSERKVGLNV